MTAYTIPQAAERLGISVWTLRSMMDRGEIGYLNPPGRHKLILQRHIAEWEEQFECPAKPNPTLSGSRDAAPGTSATAALSVRHIRETAR